MRRHETEHKSFAQPDKTREFPRGRAEVLNIGGGEVGRRKATELLEAGARVRIIALNDAPSTPREHWIAEPYRSAHLDGASLVFAAATPEVNARVVAHDRPTTDGIKCLLQNYAVAAEGRKAIAIGLDGRPTIDALTKLGPVAERLEQAQMKDDQHQA